MATGLRIKVTAKKVKAAYKHVIAVGYCEMQTLLQYEYPLLYTAGVYGKNADIYDLGDGITISTGYRPFGEDVCELYKKADVPFGFFEDKAKEIESMDRNSQHKRAMTKNVIYAMKKAFYPEERITPFGLTL